MAQLRARAPQIVRSESGEAEFGSVLLHHVPDYPLRYAVTPALPGSADTPEHFSGREFGRTNPRIHDRFDPVRHRYGSNMAAFANQIDYGPMFLSLLQMRELQISQLTPSQPAAKQHREDCTVP